MKQFVITTDTTCDLPSEYINKYNIPIIPLYYELDGTLYGGKQDLELSEFYKKMRSGSMPSTNACVPEEVKDVFLEYVKQDIPVLHIAFSSGLSSSYANCILAVNDIKEDYPNANIVVIDSLSACAGQGLMVYQAIRLQKEGYSLSETASWITNHIQKMIHLFTVDDLNHLHRGGRLSKASAVLGTLIQIKPILHVDRDGKLTAVDKIRGRKKSLIDLVERMERLSEGCEHSIFTIGHCDCLEDAEFVATLVKERYPDATILISMICPIIGSHTGPGMVALCFMGNSR